MPKPIDISPKFNSPPELSRPPMRALRIGVARGAERLCGLRNPGWGKRQGAFRGKLGSAIFRWAIGQATTRLAFGGGE